MGLQTILLAPGMGHPVRPDLRSPALNQAWRRIKPLLMGTAYYKTDPLVDRYLLSVASSGTLSLYYFAQQIYGAVSQVINKAIAAPLVPALSILNKAGDMAGFQRTYQRRLWQMGMICLVCLLCLGLFGHTLLNLLIGYGNVRTSNVKELWWIMICLGGMFVGGVLGQISSTSFYSLGDTSTPTRLGIFSYTFYVPAKVILFYNMGVPGLALVTSVFFIVNFSLQGYIIKSRYFKYT
jgi:putative peptidoglycan lipid II flippase